MLLQPLSRYDVRRSCRTCRQQLVSAHLTASSHVISTRQWTDLLTSAQNRRWHSFARSFSYQREDTHTFGKQSGSSLSSDHLLRASKSFWISARSFSISARSISLPSSANSKTSLDEIQWGKSLINIVNNCGPQTESWMTPDITSMAANWEPLYDTYWDLFYKKFMNHLCRLPQMPIFINFLLKIECETLSNARLKSRAIMSQASRLFKWFETIDSHRNSLVAVNFCWIKPYCSLQISKLEIR